MKMSKSQKLKSLECTKIQQEQKGGRTSPKDVNMATGRSVAQVLFSKQLRAGVSSSLQPKKCAAKVIVLLSQALDAAIMWAKELTQKKKIFLLQRQSNIIVSFARFIFTIDYSPSPHILPLLPLLS